MSPDLEDCLEYVLFNEFVDFSQNPSVNHIFYKASSLLYGKEKADMQLSEALMGVLL